MHGALLRPGGFAGEEGVITSYSIHYTKLYEEEIFGPLLPLVTYDTLEEAIAYVAARPHPLALYLFEQDRGATEKVLARTISGGVTVNDTLYHIAQHRNNFV